MNEKQMNKVGSRTLTLGALALVLAAALAVIMSARASADPALLPLSRAQLGEAAAVQSVQRYIALHSGDVAGSAAVNPNVDSVARYIEAHRAVAEVTRGRSAEEQAVLNYLVDHGIAFGQFITAQADARPSGLSAEELAVMNYLADHGVTFGR